MTVEDAGKIKDRFLELDVEIPITQIEERLARMEEFRVSDAEAQRSVINYFLKENNLVRTDYYVSTSAVKSTISAINENNIWMDLDVKVVSLWDNDHPSISQTGLVGDSTGVTKFVKWETADLPNMEDGKCYRLKNIVTNEYQGRFSIGLNKSSSIEEFEGDIVVAETMSSQDAEKVDIIDIESDNQWVTLKAKVTQLWDNEHESISQIGLIGDESGTIKFVKWASSDVLELVDGQTYEFTNVVTNEYQGRYSIGINKSSSVTMLDEDIEVGTSSVEFSGVIIDIQDGSGLIKRCPECRRALNKGMCVEHGRVEGTYDLRIKAILDDGVHTQEALLNKDTTQSLTGISLEKAKEMAAEALDPSVVLDAMRDQLMGSYYNVTGPRIDRYILVESVEEMDAITKDEVAEVLKMADSIMIPEKQADVSGSGDDSEVSDVSSGTGDAEDSEDSEDVANASEANASDIDTEV